MKKWIEIFKERILQILFVPSLLWAIAMIIGSEIETSFNLIPGKEDGWLHNVAESTLEFALLALFITGIICLFYHFRSFLLVPESISLGWVLIRLVAYAVIIAVVLAVVIGWGWWIFVESGQDPNDVQYGMASYSMAFFYSYFLTPVCTVLLVWLSETGRSTEAPHT